MSVIAYRPVPAPNNRGSYATASIVDATEIAIDWSGMLPTGRTLSEEPIDYTITTLTTGAADDPIAVQLSSAPTLTTTTSRARFGGGSVGGAYSISCRATLDDTSQITVALRVDTY